MDKVTLQAVITNLEAVLALPEFTEEQSRSPQQRKIHEAYISGFSDALEKVKEMFAS